MLSRAALLVSLAFSFLAFAFHCLFAAPARGQAEERDLVLFVASFPRSWERSLYRALQEEAAKVEGCKGIRFERIETLADPDTAAQALSRIGAEKALASVHVGDQSVSLTRDLIRGPALILSPLEAFDSEAQTALETTSSSPLRVGVLPSFDDCRQALESLRPLPRNLALVYSPDSESDARFAASFESHYPSLVSSASSATLCPVSPAACQNQNDMAAALQHYLSGLGKGDVLIVLPGQNTIKFAYMFRNFAEERHVGLVGVGESAVSPAFLTVDYSPSEIARYCLGRVSQLRTEGALLPTETATLAPRVRLNPSIADALGYSQTDPNVAEKPDVSGR